jgi:hypothetical protein
MNHPHNPHAGGALGGFSRPQATDKQQLQDEIASAISSSQEVMCRATTVFPLTLFPDTITVDRAKVSVTRRNFFMAGEVVTIRIEDILNVTAAVGPFFGNIKITTKYFNPEKPYIVDKLKRKDALRIKRILQGYVIARQSNLDMSDMSSRELAQYLDQAGKVSKPDKL